MKRLTASFLLIALLFLCACGDRNESTSAAAPTPSTSPEVPAVKNEAGYTIPSAWNEVSINDGSWGYLIDAADFADSENFSIVDGYLTARLIDTDTKFNTLVQQDLNGTELHRLEVPPVSQEDNVDSSVSYYCFGQEGVWFLQDSYTLDLELETVVDSSSMLQLWDYNGACIVSQDAKAAFSMGSGDVFIQALALDPDGNPVVITDQAVFFCDSQGQVTATMDSGNAFFSFCRDADGRLYLHDSLENQVYTIDWENHALGSALFSVRMDERVHEGSGGYDFLLCSESLLRGVSLEAGTITEILSWADWDLAGSVSGVAFLDEETMLTSGFDLVTFSSQFLTLTRVPADQLPEKQPVRLAVAINPNAAEWGQTWTDALDQRVTAAINQFNRTSSEYRVGVETYSSAEDLNKEILAGNAPDLIDWNSTAWLEDTPSMTIYAQRGYLTDLTPLFDADEELSTEDFIPSILELMQAHTGGFYVAPLNFYFITLSASKDYVDGPLSTFSDLLACAQAMPEDMCLMEYESQSEMLDFFLRSSIGRFADLRAGTCDFEAQEFYDLLTLCRDYCPAETGENYTPPAGGALLTSEANLGRLGQFASDVMRPLEEQGRTLIGFPGAGGSGVTIIVNDAISICAMGQQQEGAWQFLRTLYSYDFQYGRGSVMTAVRSDAFNAREDWYLEANGSCTQEESLAARQLIYDAETLRSNDSPIVPIVLEEAAAFFNGDKSAQDVAQIIQNRVAIYLGEQS